MKTRTRVLLLCVLAAAFVAAVTYAVRESAPRDTGQTAPMTPQPSGSVAPNGYDYGHGTYYVATRRNVPPNWGNAASWAASARRAGYEVGTTPRVGAIACTTRGPYGQVAIVESVSEDGKTVEVSEMFHGPDKWNVVSRYQAPAGSFQYYIY